MISVVVPIYNVEDYLDECLDSIVHQTYRDIEILCIDDCTLDNSITIVKKYMRMDPRVRLISHEENRGLGGARNTGIREAKGEYIAFIDSDDRIYPTMLEKLHAAITTHAVDVAVCGVLCTDDDSYRVEESTFHHMKQVPSQEFSIAQNKELITDMWPSVCNKLHKMSIIRESNCRFPEKLLYEDHQFFYQYFSHVNSFYYLNDILYRYRVSRPGSITSTLSGREAEVYVVLEALEPLFRSCFAAEKWKNVYAKICFRLLWERNFVLLNDAKKWNAFTKGAKEWLAKRFDMNELQKAIDPSVGKNDVFRLAVFSPYLHQIPSRMKRIIKRSKMYTILKKIYRRIRRR